MTAATVLRRPGVGVRAAAGVRSAVLGAALIAVAVGIVMALPAATPLHAAMTVGIVTVAVWMIGSARYEVTLAVVMAYVGLLDGFLKLKTGSDVATLGRDILLYAIAVGAILRWVIRREPVRLPPLSGWVIAWGAVVLVQVFNPANGTFIHSLASLRPHLEWIPLFFLGYAVMRSKRRLRGFLLLMLLIAAVNGVVGLMQFSLTPDQLASWGPGYEQKVAGTGDTSARGFVDEDGEVRTRPFGLGGDMGFGGVVGLLAVPAALAMLAMPGLALRFAVAALSSGTVLAVATSQARVAVVGSVVAVFAFALLSVTSRGAFRRVMAMGAAALIAYGMVSAISSGSEQGTFDRYGDIAPGEAVHTTYAYRKKTLELIPDYVGMIPLGAGLGSKGPAGSFGGGKEVALNAESQPTYLLIELGVPGLLVLLCFQLKLAGLALRRLRKFNDPELQMLLAAVAAPLLALLATWIVGISTASTPGAPYMWFAAGTLSYWLLGRREEAALGRVLRPVQLDPPPWAAVQLGPPPWAAVQLDPSRTEASTPA